MTKIKTFTDLKVWQQGHELVLLIYKITINFPAKENYSLTSQMRRAAISVTANIAEGFGRQTYKEKIQFYYTAQGSLTELKNYILVARDIHYLKINNYNSLIEMVDNVHRLLIGLIRKSKFILKSKI